MPCLFDVKPEDRHCRYCTVAYCDERQPKPIETHSTNKIVMTDKEQIKAIIKQYADKGKKMYSEAIDSSGSRYNAGFWDGYECCAKGLLRELEDIQEECIYSKDNYTDEDRKVLCEGCEEECEFNKKEYSVKKDLEQAIDTYIATYFGSEQEKQNWPFLKKMAIHFAEWKKQKDSIPVSKDLEEAAFDNAQKNYKEGFRGAAMQAFNEGAGWQKQQDQSTIELAEDHAMLAGMEKMKEQMMAKAVDGDITFDYYGDGDKTYGCIAHDSFCLEDFGLKDRDKVKIIVIKED